MSFGGEKGGKGELSATAVLFGLLALFFWGGSEMAFFAALRPPDQLLNCWGFLKEPELRGRKAFLFFSPSVCGTHFVCVQSVNLRHMQEPPPHL